MGDAKVENIILDSFVDEGLYLLFSDSTRIELTKKNIENSSDAFWQDPSRITPAMKKAIDFQKCPFCPRKNKEDICDAIRPVLPFLDKIDKYLSFDEVTAVYKSSQDGMVHVKQTTMQKALQYVSILSLLRYNLILRRYWKYYYGAIPLMDGREVAAKVYINMYWYHKGNKEELDRTIAQFKEELTISSENQVKRMNLVCKNDVFMNAFVNTQVVSEFLTMDIEDTLKKTFENFEQSYMHHY
ncbi:MAG: hypothetical protein KKC84_00895 [Candidatus Omnitrophica bacterium]|nr:hypothetical protein [Candidatus Omnitrophota bacterium]